MKSSFLCLRRQTRSEVFHRQKVHAWQLFLPLVFFVFLSPPFVWSEDDNQGVLAAGVVHNIAPDRKVVKVGGIMQPEPLDFYLKRLFDDLSKKIDQLDQRLQTIETLERQNASRVPAVTNNPETKKTK